MSFVERPRSQIREREEVDDRLMELRHRIAHLERVEAGLPEEALETDIASRLRASLVHDDLLRAREEFEELSPYARAFAPAAAERPVDRHPSAQSLDPTDEVIEFELPGVGGAEPALVMPASDCAAGDVPGRPSIDLIRMRGWEPTPAPPTKTAKLSAVLLPVGHAVVRTIAPERISGRVLAGAAGFLVVLGLVGTTALVGQSSSVPPAGGSVALVREGNADGGDLVAMLTDESSASDEGAQDESRPAGLAGLGSSGLAAIPMRLAPAATAAIRRILESGEQVEMMASRAVSGGLAWRQGRSNTEVGSLPDD